MTCRNTHPELWQREINQFAYRRHLKTIGGDIKPGDIYVANRNLDPILLTCKMVIETEDLSGNVVDRQLIPMEKNEFTYNVYDCVRVVENGVGTHE